MENKIDLNSLTVNTEFAIHLAEFKILSEFLANSLIYSYQTRLTDEDITLMGKKFEKLKEIVNKYLFEPKV